MKKFRILILILVISSMLPGSQIKNPDKPLKGYWDLKLEKAWAVKTAGDSIFGRIQDIKIGKDGNVYVIDPKFFKIHIFSKDGKYISSFGKKGAGPGEITELRMGAQLFILEKNIVVIEKGKAHFFSPLGKYIRREVIPPFISPRAFISEDVLISAPVIVQNVRGGGIAKLKTYNLKNKEERIIDNFKPYEKASDSQEGNGSGRMIVGIVVPGVTPMMVINYEKDNLYYGMSDSYIINKITLTSEEKTSFSIDGRIQKDVPESKIKRLAKRLKDIPQDMVKRILNGLPKKSSYFMDIFTVYNGMVFVSTPTPGVSFSHVFDIFSSEGKYLYKTEIKVDSECEIRNLYLQNETLILALEDDDGELSLVKYSISLPQ